MNTQSQRPDHGDAISWLNAAIEAMNLVKEVSSMTPAKAAFGSVSLILTMIRDSMANEADYVELGLACVDVCKALDRGMGGKRMGELSLSVFEAIAQLTTTVAEIQKNVVKQSKRNPVSRLFHAKSDKETIATWRLELNRILHVFNTELAMNTHIVVSGIHHNVVNTHTIISDVHHDVVNTHAIVSELRYDVKDTHTMVSNMHRNMVNSQGGTNYGNLLAQTSSPGESPPPPPRACFGRDELVEKIVGFAEKLTPIALIGAGGIGKTSIALTVLHNDRIKQQFGEDRRFIRCDQFPASRTHFLHQLSKVIGASAQNIEDLTPLRPFLSSKKILIVLDNVESVLDPQGTNAQEIYAVVEELSRLKTICLFITSRISTVPPDCKTPNIPTLSMEAAHDTFYHIYRNGERSDLVGNVLERLDFHPLSITLLATVAHHNKWDTNRLIREWEQRRTAVLHTRYNRSLAATLELSLTSPMFQELGPDARDLLGVVAFFPQGVDENNLDWLFPAISNRKYIFDTFCVLSLTYRNNDFITMLAPLRDYLCPKDPKSSPPLCATKECYFTRLSAGVNPGEPGFEETRWIMSEDVNVEHLLDVFTTIDASSNDVWDACANFMDLLHWHKQRLVLLGPKIEGLPDGHSSKPQCLLQLSYLFVSVVNNEEGKRLLVHALKLWRERRNDHWVAQTLVSLANTNTRLCLCAEGMLQAKEALEIFERLNDTEGQSASLRCLALLFARDNQIDAAEEAASRAINISPDNLTHVCEHHYTLARVYESRGEIEAAISHHKAALEIASSLNLRGRHATILRCLVLLLLKEGRLDEAQVYLEHLNSHAVDSLYCLGLAAVVQICVWHRQGRFEEAESEISRVRGVFEKSGFSADALELCERYLREIEENVNNPVTSDSPDESK